MVSPGGTVTVNWTVTNTYKVGQYFKIEFYLGSSKLTSKYIGYISSGSSRSGSFTIKAPSSSGTYTLKGVLYSSYDSSTWLDIDDAQATFNVIGGSTVGFNVSVSPTTVKPGETVTVKWSLSNTLGVPGYFKIDFYLDGDKLTSKYLGSVGPGYSKSGSFAITATPSTGTHTVKGIVYISFDNTTWTDIDDAQATFQVATVTTPTIKMSVKPSISAEAGKSFTVPVTITISGLGHPLSVKAEVEIGGNRYEATETLPGDGTYTVNVDVRQAPTTSGTYTGIARAYYYVSSGNWEMIGSDQFTLYVTGSVNPITDWSVSVNPSTVKPGDSVQVVVTVYSNSTVPVRATVNLFGQTQTKEGTAPAPLTFTFTAPTKAGTYTGSIKLEAYY